MVAEITTAILEELKALFDAENVTICLQNELRSLNLPSYGLPLIILKLNNFGNSDDNIQCLGGTSKACWDYSIKCYEYEPNPELNPDQQNSINLLNIVDVIRYHFNFQEWKSTEFQAAYDDMSLRLTVTGITRAEDLKIDNGLAFGFELKYNSVAFDTTTTFTQLSDETLLIVTGTVTEQLT